MVTVVVIWLNYNGRGIWDEIVKPSLRSVLNLEEDSFRRIVLAVDGHSTDGSDELIKKEIEDKPSAYFLRLSRNGGYAGNNAEGYKYAINELGADYVVFVNNDFIVEPDSLRRMFNYLVKNEYAGVQGLELRPGGLIGNAGMMHDEFARVISICSGYAINDCELDKPYYITFPIGSYMLYSVDTIDALPDKIPFIPETFAGFDDNYLGLMMWNKGFRVAYVPVKEGVHYGSATTRYLYKDRFKPTVSRQGLKTRIALWENLECRLKPLFNIYRRKIYAYYTFYTLVERSMKEVIKEGFELANLIRSKVKTIDLEKTVHIEFSTNHYIARALLPRSSIVLNIPTHVKYLQKYIKKPVI